MAALVASLATLVVAEPALAQETGFTVTKTVSPTSRTEPGGDFTFTVRITMSAGVSVTISSLTDDKFGNLAGRGTCRDGVRLSGEFNTFTCTFTAPFTGNAGDHVSTTTAEVTTERLLGSLSASGQTTITLTNVAPTVTVTHSAAPASRPAPGGEFTYSTVVTNTSAEAVTIRSLVDDIYGNMAVRGSCRTAVGTTLRPLESYRCSFVEAFTGADRTSLIDQVTVTVTDDDGSSAVARATATVAIASAPTTATTGRGTTTSTDPTTTSAPQTTVTTSGTTTTLAGLEVLSGPSSEPGGEVRVRGRGCPGGSDVAFLAGGTAIGEVQAGPDGSFEATLTAPAVEPGRLELVADCGARLAATVDLVVASRVDPLASTLAVFLFFVLLSQALFRRRRLILPRPPHRPDED